MQRYFGDPGAPRDDKGAPVFRNEKLKPFQEQRSEFFEDLFDKGGTYTIRMLAKLWAESKGVSDKTDIQNEVKPVRKWLKKQVKKGRLVCVDEYADEYNSKAYRARKFTW